jgi:hypothetical protein
MLIYFYVNTYSEERTKVMNRKQILKNKHNDVLFCLVVFFSKYALASNTAYIVYIHINTVLNFTKHLHSGT